MGDDTTAAAARRMRLLTDDLARPRSGPRDANRGQVRTSQPTHARPPMHLGILDHVRRSVDEVITHTRAENPDAGPAPADPSQVYAWSRDRTAHCADEQQKVREAIVYRHSLEHSLRAGDEDVVRPIRCPNCQCLSLFWRARQQRVVCLYQRCSPDGVPRVWTLAQLAQHQIEKKPRRAAT